MALLAVILMRETYPNVLLQRKARAAVRLGVQGSTGNKKQNSKHPKQPQFETQRRPHGPPLNVSGAMVASLIRPCRLLIESPILLVMSIYVAFVSGTLYLLLTTFASVFEGQYGFSTTISGLSYLGLGAALIVAMVVFRVLGPRVQNHGQKDQALRPESRLILMIWFSPLLGMGLFLYGWTTYYKVHWIVPMLSTSVIGFGVFFVLVSLLVPQSSRVYQTELLTVTLTDAGTAVPRRPIWLPIIRLGPWCQQSASFSRQHFFATGWSSNVPILGLWLGKYIARIYRVVFRPSSYPFS